MVFCSLHQCNSIIAEGEGCWYPDGRETSECTFFRNVSGVHLDAWFPCCLASGCVHYREETCKDAGRRPQLVV